MPYSCLLMVEGNSKHLEEANQPLVQAILTV